jgi:hypothetical protein
VLPDVTKRAKKVIAVQHRARIMVPAVESILPNSSGPLASFTPTLWPEDPKEQAATR